jgi:hypothetical protein
MGTAVPEPICYFQTNEKSQLSREEDPQYLSQFLKFNRDQLLFNTNKSLNIHLTNPDRHGPQNNSCSIGHRETGPEMVQFIQRTTQSIEGHRQHRLRGIEFTLLRFLVESHQEEQIVVFILISLDNRFHPASSTQEVPLLLISFIDSVSGLHRLLH